MLKNKRERKQVFAGMTSDPASTPVLPFPYQMRRQHFCFVSFCTAGMSTYKHVLIQWPIQQVYTFIFLAHAGQPTREYPIGENGLVKKKQKIKKTS